MVHYLYATARTPSNYQDAALIGLMSYVFGRASDLSLVQKESISVTSDGVLFIRRLRVKTNEQQGLSLFPDNDIRTCPILALTTALALQAAPWTPLLESVQQQPAIFDATTMETAPLMELLIVAEGDPPTPSVSTPVKPSNQAVAQAPGIQQQVNRLLSRICSPANVLIPLTSHSFRRGGAQHANGHPGINIQWIMDRGGWSLSSTHKVFSYVVNTTQEDQRVSKVLSGWPPDKVVPLDSLDGLDAQTAIRICKLQKLLHNTCSGMQDDRLNVCARALDACTSRLIRALPELRQLNPDAPIVLCVEVCARQAGVDWSELLQWATTLTASTQDVVFKEKEKLESAATSDFQAAVIRELIQTNKLLVKRLEVLEAKLQVPPPPGQAVVSLAPDKLSPTTQPAPRAKCSTTCLSSVWFEWFAGEPRLWSSVDRKKRSDAKLSVAYMKLFLGSLDLDQASHDYRDRVLFYGQRAEKNLLEFLTAQGVRAKGSSSILKHMRELHRHGKLDGHIAEHKSNLASGAFNDPSPHETQNTLSRSQ